MAVRNPPQILTNGLGGQVLWDGSGNLIVQPQSGLALQAQATTSSATGGNARGANAVDWQTTRTAATQVASTSGSVIGGGANNGTGGAGANSVIGGGVNNNTTGGYASVIGGGAYNGVSNYYSVIAGGYANSVGGQNSVISGGLSNSAQGYHNIIVGGYGNSGTSASAVTTQATTTVTSGSTAVTLSASNASIKVGQIVTGTGIVGSGTGVWTYVAAISGTSLTLSQNANASGSPTLSFYTPHGIVVGGGNNQATGSYSFVGGGGDAGTAANRNVASGDWSAIMGGRGGTTRGITGYHVFPACSVPIASGAGYSQSGLLVLGKQTTDATATVITSDGGSATTLNQVVLPNNSAYYVSGSIVAGVTGAGNTATWTFQGAIKRGSGVGTTAIVGSGITAVSVAADAGASTWAVSITADTTNGGLAVTVTGQASTTIRWVCKVETTEMTY